MTKPMLLGVADALIIGSNGLQLFSATLSSHTIEQSVDSTDLRGGRGNKLIGRLKTNKNLSVTLDDLQQTKEMQALISGAEIKEDATVAYTMPQTVKYPATGTGGIPLAADKQLKDGMPIYCYDAAGKQYLIEVDRTPGAVKVKVGEDDGTNVTNNIQNELAPGTEVLLGAYVYTVDKAKHFTIKSNEFADTVAVILKEDVYDGETMDIIAVKQTIIPLATPDENFSLSGSAEIGETTASYTFTALASKDENGDCENVLGYVVYLDPETNC